MDITEKLNMRQVVRVWAVEQVLAKLIPLPGEIVESSIVVEEAKKIEDYVNSDMQQTFSTD